MGNVKIKQFSDKNKELIAGLTPEHAVYDAKGVRLDAKIGSILDIKNTVATQGKNLDNLTLKVNALAVGIFYGYRANESELPQDITENGYAYVGTDNPYKIYNFDGTQWKDSGTTIQATSEADEEDITYNENDKLTFRDRDNIDGMGYVILRKNKSFAEQVIKENTIYEIRYDFILSNNITIPANCVLKFCGGSINGAYIITGTNTCINASLMKIFSTDVIIAGTWNINEVYPEWFGAKGDGITDDTNAINLSLKLEGANKVVFSNKTYIINIKQGTDTTTTSRNIFDSIKVYNIVGTGNSRIKLGSGNGDVQSYRGYGAIFYFTNNKDIIVDDIVFDFNYAENPIYQDGGTNIGVENNGQQCAIIAYSIAGLIVRNCTFIEPSGTNTIAYMASDTADHLHFICENNNFIDVGNKSFHRSGGDVLDAYHDVSTIGCHFKSGGNSNAKLTAIIRNNTARGVGGNAFDFCECHADSMIFENNTIINYKYCVMPLSGVTDITASIINNKFINCVKGVNIWNLNEDNIIAEKGSYGYKELNITNNYAIMDFMLWYNTPCYGNTTKDKNNLYNSGNYSYGFVSFNGQGNKNIKLLKINNNYVEYKENISEVPSSYIVTNGFGVISAYYTPYYTDIDSVIDTFEIKFNTIKNAPNLILSNNGFNKIDTFVFSDNVITDLYSNPNNNNRQEGFLRDIVFGSASLDRKLSKAIIINNSVECYPNTSTWNECFGLIRNKSMIEHSIVFIKGNSFYGETYKSLVTIENVEYIDRDGNKTNKASKPTNLGTNDVGYQYFDAMFGKPIYWTGSKWVDATGADM